MAYEVPPVILPQLYTAMKMIYKHNFVQSIRRWHCFNRDCHQAPSESLIGVLVLVIEGYTISKGSSRAISSAGRHVLTKREVTAQVMVDEVMASAKHAPLLQVFLHKWRSSSGCVR